MRTTDLAKVRATLWAAADELRANSKLTPVQYRDPVLGLVFLAYAENRFEGIRAEVESRASARNPATVADYKAKSVLYVPDESRLSYLVGLPEGDDIGKAVDDAIKAIEATNPELKDMRRRFWLGLVFALPVVVLEMGGHVTGLSMRLGGQTSAWIQLALATPVVLWSGWPFLARGARSIANRSLNMFTLIAMGVGVAWIYSVVATLAPDVYPQDFHGSGIA